MKFKKSSANERGFTLIELLVVVMVISALSGVVISIINSGGFRDKARDAQRISDLKQVQTALELYFSDFRQYPNSGGASWLRLTGSDALSAALSPTYINKVPSDPQDTGGSGTNDPCGTPTSLRYNYRSDGNYYLLTAIMAVATSNDESECTVLNSWGSSCPSGFATQDVCYGVENP